MSRNLDSGDQPQLQWAEDMINRLIQGFVNIFVLFGRTMRSVWIAATNKD